MAEEETLLLKERVRVNGSLAEATLAADGGELWWRGEGGGSGGKGRLTVESDVLGIEIEGTQGRRLKVKAFENASNGVCCGGGGSAMRRVRRDYVFEMPAMESASRWSDRIRNRINSFGRPKRLFIIVNPFGGTRRAQRKFQNEVKPLLEAAGIRFTMQETNHQLHAQEIARSLDLVECDGIVCVSGDGVLVEVINGLLQREDWETAIKVPLGIIPAGSGNGMAKSLLDSVGDLFTVSNAVFAIIRGNKRSLDVASVVQGKTKFFSVLLLTWGLVADIDIESEKYRWMGSTRFDIYSLLRIMNLRRYNGRIQFVPAPGYEGLGNSVEQVKTDRSHASLGPLVEHEGSQWRYFEGPFISVSINNVPWINEDIKLAPEAQFSDGYLDAVIVRDCPRSALLALLLKMSGGSYVNSPYVIYLKVKAFQIEPGYLVGNPDRGGIVDSDGEVIARGAGAHVGEQREYLMAYGPPIQMTVDHALATIFCPR
ncbi:sphingosine kinase 1-like [Typha angustifolia]|uniref:sphingosine kinase 1-like n=1 Tax=Typha angustifolia TaxID=59011 RepID=UPI003C3041EF